MEPSLKLKKIWADEEAFFEVNWSFAAEHCKADMDVYTDNDELEALRQGVINVAHLSQKEFTWSPGENMENPVSFLSLRFFLHDKRGYAGIEVTIDRKEAEPYGMRANFFLITVLGQLDDFTRKLEEFIKGKTNELTSFLPECQY